MKMEQIETDKTVEQCWWISADGSHLRDNEDLELATGQVLDFSLYARVPYSTPSKERQVWQIRRGNVYDVNAKVVAVTMSEGDYKDSIQSVIDFGLRARTQDSVHEGVLERSNYWVSARVELSLEQLCRAQLDWYPLARHCTYKWRIEEMHRSCSIEKEGARDSDYETRVESVTKARVTDWWERAFKHCENRAEPFWNLWLKCRLLGPADKSRE
jgi:hypothetical protein